MRSRIGIRVIDAKLKDKGSIKMKSKIIKVVIGTFAISIGASVVATVFFVRRANHIIDSTILSVKEYLMGLEVETNEAKLILAREEVFRILNKNKEYLASKREVKDMIEFRIMEEIENIVMLSE